MFINKFYMWFFMRIKEDLIGKEVLDGEVTLIGKINDVIIDNDTFEITDLVVKKSGFGKTGEDVVPAELIKVIGDKVLLKSDDDL